MQLEHMSDRRPMFSTAAANDANPLSHCGSIADRFHHSFNTPLDCSSRHRSSSIQITSPTTRVDCKTQAQLGNEWWQFFTEIPTAQNPLSDPTGTISDVAQAGLVHFLAGLGGQPGINAVTRSITVHNNQFLFTPVINQTVDNVGFPPEWSANDSRIVANAIVNAATNLFFNQVQTVHGQRVETSLINDRAWSSYRQQSPTDFSYVVPANNIGNYPAGTTVEEVISDGYWVMVNPLPVGEYQIHFGGTINYSNVVVDQNHNSIEGDTLAEQILQTVRDSHLSFTQDITYHIRVVPSNVDISTLAR